MGLPNILMMEVKEKVPEVFIYLLDSTVYIRSKLSMRLACVEHTTKNISHGCHLVLVDYWGRIWYART